MSCLIVNVWKRPCLPCYSCNTSKTSHLQDVRRIETKGPAVDDLIHTVVVEPADEEQGYAAEQVLQGLPHGSELQAPCTYMPLLWLRPGPHSVARVP
jgi:hypothetical protein